MTARHVMKRKIDNEPPKAKSPLAEILEWIAYLAVSIGIALLIVNFVGRLTIVDGNSMYPTLGNRNIVVSESVSLRFQEVGNGDVVVLRIPEMLGGNRTYAIKRVIATSGQTIRFADGRIYIDGVLLDEPYVNGRDTLAVSSLYSDMAVPEGTIYVLGDNRTPDKSRDSRLFGPVNQQRIIGRAWVRIFPFSDIGMVR